MKQHSALSSQAQCAPMSIGSAFDQGRNNFHLIRLAAALAVIYGHSHHVTGEPGGDFFLTLVGYKFIGGVAVDIFFVVSGFLIAASLTRSSIKRYLLSRCLRILPALFVAVAVCTFVLGPLLTNDPVYWSSSQTWRYFFNNALLIRTEYFLPGVFGGLKDPAINGSLWSLPVEFRLYGLLLLVSIFGLLNPTRFFGFSLACVAAGLYLAPRVEWFQTYHNWVSSSAFFLAGTYLWVYRYQVRLSHWYVLALLALALLTHGQSGFYVAYFATLSYLVLYVALAVRLPVIKRNDISYGVYLYGWPVQQCVALLTPGHSAIYNTTIASIVTIIVAFASWRLVEQPMLQLKSKPRQ